MTRSTSRVRGPWTPSTRFSSMSEVAEGPEIKVIGRALITGGRVQTGHGLRHQPDHLVVADDAQVVVRQQGDGAAALAGSAVEHNRPCLRNSQRGRREHAIAVLENVVAEPWLAQQGHTRWRPSIRQVGRHHQPLRARAAQASAMACVSSAGRTGRTRALYSRTRSTKRLMRSENEAESTVRYERSTGTSRARSDFGTSCSASRILPSTAARASFTAFLAAEAHALQGWEEAAPSS